MYLCLLGNHFWLGTYRLGRHPTPEHEKGMLSKTILLFLPLITIYFHNIWAEVDIISRSTCNGGSSYGGDISAQMICAGVISGGIDTCQASE